MLEAVSIIINRLESHPEDFFGEINDRSLRVSNPRFNRIRSDLDMLVGKYQEDERPRFWYLTEAEKEALRVAYTKACRERFQAETMHTLLSQEAPPSPAQTLWSGAVGTAALNSKQPSAILTPASMQKAALEIMEQQIGASYK